MANARRSRTASTSAPASGGFAFHALTPDRWNDFEHLFGVRGACAGCWCMYWRQRGKAWTERNGDANKSQFRALVMRGPPPGILAYDADHPVGWCQTGPHASFARFVHARTKRPLDDRPTWVINCFFIARSHRGRNLMSQLLEAAVALAKNNGAARAEGFPANTESGRIAATFAYVGTASAFAQAGFHRITRTIGATTSVRYVRDLSQ